MNKIFALAAGTALAVCAQAADKKKEKRAMEWKGAFCAVTEPAQIVVRTKEEWDALWKKIGKPAPEADLKKFFAVGIFLGSEPTGGYAVTWEAAAAGKVVIVRFRVKKPDGMAIQAFTQPYAVKLFAKAAGEIKVIQEGG